MRIERGDSDIPVDNLKTRVDADIDFFHSSRIFVDEAGSALSDVVPARESVSAADFINGSPVKHLMCWRREFGLKIGGVDESLDVHGADDYDFPWTAAERGARSGQQADRR